VQRERPEWLDGAGGSEETHDDTLGRQLDMGGGVPNTLSEFRSAMTEPAGASDTFCEVLSSPYVPSASLRPRIRSADSPGAGPPIRCPPFPCHVPPTTLSPGHSRRFAKPWIPGWTAARSWRGAHHRPGRGAGGALPHACQVTRSPTSTQTTSAAWRNCATAPAASPQATRLGMYPSQRNSHIASIDIRNFHFSSLRRCFSHCIMRFQVPGLLSLHFGQQHRNS